jgi:hypothetical protein
MREPNPRKSYKRLGTGLGKRRLTHFETVPFDHSGTSPETEYAPMVVGRRHLYIARILLAPLRQLAACGIGLNARIDLWSLIYIVRRLPGSVLWPLIPLFPLTPCQGGLSKAGFPSQEFKDES